MEKVPHQIHEPPVPRSRPGVQWQPRKFSGDTVFESVGSSELEVSPGSKAASSQRVGTLQRFTQALCGILLLTAVGTRGQGVTWGTNVTLSGDSDVFTNGALLYAYDWANTNKIVNGVAFTGTSSANAGNASVSGITGYYQGFNSSSQPFAGLSAAYRSILTGGEYASGAGLTATVTLNGLTVGHVYAVQIWVSDPRASGGEVGRTETATGINQVTLAYNVPPSPGGVGQFSIGVFTATSGSQTFTLLSNGSSGSTQLNALLVSDITATGYQPVNPAPPTRRLRLNGSISGRTDC